MLPFTRNITQYLPDAVVLAALLLLLLPRWRRQGRRRLAVNAVFCLYTVSYTHLTLPTTDVV